MDSLLKKHREYLTLEKSYYHFAAVTCHCVEIGGVLSSRQHFLFASMHFTLAETMTGNEGDIPIYQLYIFKFIYIINL